MKKIIVSAVIFAVIIGVYKMKKTPRNVRNNNPLNIRESARWDGERAVDSDKAFEEFKSPEYGFRAAYIILLQYLERGDNTIQKIVSKWAPATENHTSAYINYIAEKLILSPAVTLLPTDLALLMLHMANYEGANGAFTIEQAQAGVELAKRSSFVVARLARLANNEAVV